MKNTQRLQAILFGCIYLGIFLAALSLRVHYMDKREDMHLDEVLSIVLSEYNGYGWGAYFEEGVIQDSQSLREKLLWNDSTALGAWQDVYKLHKNNRDLPHTNLYYSLLRLWHTGFIDTNLSAILHRGITLNMLFFILSFCFAFFLIQKLLAYIDSITPLHKTIQHSATALFLFLCFLNPASITNTLFMRPYALQECLMLLFLLTLMRFGATLHDYTQNPLVKKKLFYDSALLSVVTAFLFLSGYFALFFVGLVFGFYFIFVRYARKILIFIGLASFALTLLCYNKYIRGLRYDRGQEAREKINFDYLVHNLKDITESMFSILSNNLGVIALVLLGVALCLGLYHAIYAKRAKKERIVFLKQHAFIILSCLTSVYIYAVMFVAPYKTLRYIMPAFPVLLLGIPYLLIYIYIYIYIGKGIFYRIAFFTCSLIALFACYTVVDFSLQQKRIENMDNTIHRSVMALESEAKNEVIAALIQSKVSYSFLVPYTETGRYMFFHTCDTFKEAQKRENFRFLVVYEKNDCDMDSILKDNYTEKAKLADLRILYAH